MDFEQAAQAHRDWNMKLRLYLNGSGEVDYHTIKVDNLCALGKWIYAEAQKHEQFPDFEKLRLIHADFHTTAAEIVKMIDEGKKEQAKIALEAGQKFRTLSMEIITLLASLEKQTKVA